MADKIILMGFMGCGKSTIGKVLSKKLGMPFVDLDDVIEKEAKTSISKIFAGKGEKYFRQLETKVLKNILDRDEQLILALGGGTPCHNNNLKLIKRHPSFYINCGVDLLTSRLRKERSHRPIIAEQDDKHLKSFIKNKLSERRSFYEQATYTNQGYRSVRKISDRIIALLN